MSLLTELGEWFWFILYKDVAPTALLPQEHKAGLLSQLARQGRSWGFPVWLASQDADKFLTQGTNETNFAQLAQRVENLGVVTILLAGTTGVVFDQFDDVAAFEAFGREVAGQHQVLVEFELHRAFRLSGSKATNLVSPDKCLDIQMAGIASGMPFGPVKWPQVSQYWPNGLALPHSVVGYGSIASSTSGAMGVVALWSGWITVAGLWLAW